jgi:multiple sugar transport system ATP-binding protein
MADVLLDNVSRVHGDGTMVVSHLSLYVRDGELLVLVGPSGCGKTTTLRMIAGIEPVTSGTIRIGGQDMAKVPPHERDIAMVFEGNWLYPHLTAGANLRFGLAMRHLPKQEIEKRVGAESNVLGLSRLLHRLPKTLSAGQRQRVAVGRATVRAPRVFLLDEPLTHLDAGERLRLRTELGQLLRGLGATTIYVTHDQSQAMALGDRVAVMRAGVIEQVDTPRGLWQRPATAFVAGFLGDPAMYLARGRLEIAQGRPDQAWVVLGGQRLRFPGVPSGGLRGRAGREVVVGIRVEHVAEARPVRDGGDPAAGPTLRATVERVEHLGHELLAYCGVGAQPAGEEGSDGLVVRLPRDRRVALGAPLELTVDTGRLSFFDPVSGAALWHGE